MINDFLNNPEWKLKFICVGWAFIGFMGLTLGFFIAGDISNLDFSLDILLWLLDCIGAIIL